MKTTMKTILSIFMVTVLFYSCTKDTPDPVDCMQIENGLAVLDQCGTCHQSYMYAGMGSVTYVDTYSDTVGLSGTFVLAGSPMDVMSNPNWNGGPLAAIDSCGDCHQSYIYDFVTHVPTYINDTTGLVLGATEMIVIAGSPADIASNPNWNAGCE